MAAMTMEPVGQGPSEMTPLFTTPPPGYDEWEAQDFPPQAEPYDSGEWNSDYDEPCIDHDGDAEAWPRLQAGRYRF